LFDADVVEYGARHRSGVDTVDDERTVDRYEVDVAEDDIRDRLPERLGSDFATGGAAEADDLLMNEIGDVDVRPLRRISQSRKPAIIEHVVALDRHAVVPGVEERVGQRRI